MLLNIAGHPVPYMPIASGHPVECRYNTCPQLMNQLADKHFIFMIMAAVLSCQIVNVNGATFQAQGRGTENIMNPTTQTSAQISFQT